MIEQSVLERAAKENPRSAIHLFRGFLSGDQPQNGALSMFGFVPNDWDGKSTVTILFNHHADGFVAVGGEIIGAAK